MVESYPDADEADIDDGAERVIASVVDIIRAIRNARAQHNVVAAHWVSAQVYAGELKEAILPYIEAIQALSRAKPVTFSDGRRKETAEGEVSLVLDEVDVVIPLAAMVDLEAEQKRIEQEKKQLKEAAARLEERLSNKQFLAKAPSHVVDAEKQRLATLKDKLERLGN